MRWRSRQMGFCGCRPRRAAWLRWGLLANLFSMTCAAVLVEATESSKSRPTHPLLSLFENDLLTSAKDDFNGNEETFAAAIRWSRKQLGSRKGASFAPHLACAKYGNGLTVLSRLQSVLGPTSNISRPVCNSADTGVCYVLSVSDDQGSVLSSDPAKFMLASITPFPFMLKLAPGLLEYNPTLSAEATSARLCTAHGEQMRMSNVEGLTVELTPGVLPANDPAAGTFMSETLGDLMSLSLNLHATNFWSDPGMLDGEDGHLAKSERAQRAREWTRAATVVHGLSSSALSPGSVCSWDSVSLHHPDADILLVSGLDHLLSKERGVGERDEDAEELKIACFMGLVSFLSSRPEVLRVAPRHKMAPLNAAAYANIQSATVTDTPLSDAGLDGTGEVIQVVDTGLDYSSCFFIDEDGVEVDHGYFFEELGVVSDSSSYYYTQDSFFVIFLGGNFRADMSRRKLVQYINLVRPDGSANSQANGDYYDSPGGKRYYFVDADEYGDDYAAGHGTHTAGSAVGATISSPANMTTCPSDRVLSCAGGCIDEYGLYGDDLVSYTSQTSALADLDRLCPKFDCDGMSSDVCLSDDTGTVLADHGGMARGAKLSTFDVFAEDSSVGTYLPGNGLWQPPLEIGGRLHSNSWGGDLDCRVDAFDIMYDTFMYENPENLLIFAAGNEGEPLDPDRTSCTIGSPAIGKNALAVGATSSGSTRVTFTDGYNAADIDTVASFSSYGPTMEGRIKPEVVAPGDYIYSAAGDGTGDYTCRLWMYAGTSMSCPIVAGAAAMVRQYFVDSSFYAQDVRDRGFCGGSSAGDSLASFTCAGFSPSSATVKAMLINSANLMGGSSEPDGYRGFGRVHLEAGMPLKGEGAKALFVADSNITTIPELTRHEYLFDVNGTAGLELRVTLSWIDVPSSPFSSEQQVHNLDLAVKSPNGTRYTMWKSGETDLVNVNERVIVDASSVEADSGTWTISVLAKRLTMDTQAYSLVVTGAISPRTLGSGSETPAPTASTTTNLPETPAPTASTTTNLPETPAPTASTATNLPETLAPITVGPGGVSTTVPWSGTGEPLTTTAAPSPGSRESLTTTATPHASSGGVATSMAWSAAKADFVGSVVSATVAAVFAAVWAA